MARKTVIISDLSGEEGAEEVSFSWDGQAYTIDLLEAEKEKIAKLLAPYLEKASRVKGETVKATPKKKTDAPDPRVVREWAAGQGIEVSSKGRVPGDVIEKYLAAH